MTRKALAYHLGQWALCGAACAGSWLASVLIPAPNWLAIVAMLCGWTFGIVAGVRIARDVDGDA